MRGLLPFHLLEMPAVSLSLRDMSDLPNEWFLTKLRSVFSSGVAWKKKEPTLHKKMENHVGTAVQEGKGSKAQRDPGFPSSSSARGADAGAHQPTCCLGGEESSPSPCFPTQQGIGGNGAAKSGILGLITNVLFCHYIFYYIILFILTLHSHFKPMLLILSYLHAW